MNNAICFSDGEDLTFLKQLSPLTCCETRQGQTGSCDYISENSYSHCGAVMYCEAIGQQLADLTTEDEVVKFMDMVMLGATNSK